jgi:hypothetical protein
MARPERNMTNSQNRLPAAAASLGILKAEYRPSLFRFLVLVLWGSSALLFALTILGNLALVFLFSKPANLPGGHPPSYLLFVVVAGLGWFGGYLLRKALLFRGGHVLAMTEGLVQVWRGQVVVARWDDIVRIWRREEPSRLFLPDRCYLRLELADGQNVYLANTGVLLPCLVLPAARFAGLRTDLERETNLRKLPGLLEALEAGQTLTFDQLSVSRAGLRWQGKSYSWEQIFHLEIGHTPFLGYGQQRWALVLLGGKQLRFAMDEIPNLALLWALIEIVRADSFAPRKEGRSQSKEASRHAADLE